MYKYKAKLVRVLDGDTVDAMIDLGFDIWIKKRIRLIDIDAYEVRTRNKEEKEKGLVTKGRLEKRLALSDNEFLLVSHGTEKYGRCLGEMFVTKDYIRSDNYHGKSINKWLLAEGLVKKYGG